MTNDSERVLDETGWALLCALQEDARSSYAELGRRVGLTAPAVADRIRRLEVAGIITGYHAAVDPTKLGLGLTAIIRFFSPREPYERIYAVIAACPEIIECHRVTGDDCMTLTAVVSSVEHLQELITRLAPYGTSNTSLVLSSPLHHRVIGPAALMREKGLLAGDAEAGNSSKGTQRAQRAQRQKKGRELIAGHRVHSGPVRFGD